MTAVAALRIDAHCENDETPTLFEKNTHCRSRCFIENRLFLQDYPDTNGSESLSEENRCVVMLGYVYMNVWVQSTNVLVFLIIFNKKKTQYYSIHLFYISWNVENTAAAIQNVQPC